MRNTASTTSGWPRRARIKTCANRPKEEKRPAGRFHPTRRAQIRRAGPRIGRRWHGVPCEETRGRPVSRILCHGLSPGDDHSSGPLLAKRLEQPTRIASAGGAVDAEARAIPIRPCSWRGLPCRLRRRRRGGLLPHRFTLTGRTGPKAGTVRQTVLCGAFPRVTPGGRYPPPFLPGVRTFLGVAPAAARPSARLPPMW